VELPQRGQTLRRQQSIGATCVACKWFAAPFGQDVKLSNDPDFIEKLEDVVGLYMNPPENALVFCVDEKSRTGSPAKRWSHRTQPGLAMILQSTDKVLVCTHATFRFAVVVAANRDVLHKIGVTGGKGGDPNRKRKS
jgi:hypothetical protein